MQERKAELLEVPYFHIVFTLPAEIGAIAYQNKAVIYDLLFKAASDTMLTIAADPEHLGAKIGITAVLHTWGSAMTHHPHLHMIVTGGGISPDGSRWIASRPDYLVPVEVQIQGLPPRRPGPVQNHDAGAGRVHSAVPHARPAQGLPPHPALRPARQWRRHAR
jgi:hypothetical protein